MATATTGADYRHLNKEGKPNAMNAAWGGQWDMHEIMISLGSHQTTDNLAVNPEFTVAGLASIQILLQTIYCRN